QPSKNSPEAHFLARFARFARLGLTLRRQSVRTLQGMRNVGFDGGTSRNEVPGFGCRVSSFESAGGASVLASRRPKFASVGSRGRSPHPLRSRRPDGESWSGSVKPSQGKSGEWGPGEFEVPGFGFRVLGFGWNRGAHEAGGKHCPAQSSPVKPSQA